MARVRTAIPGVVYLPDADWAKYAAAGALTDETLIGAYQAAFALHRDRIALSSPTELTTYGELDSLTDRGAAALWRLGLRPLDRAIFQMRNCKGLVVAFLSCLKLGVIPVCTLAAHREQEVGYLGNHAEAKAHFVHGDDERFDMVAFALRMQREVPSVQHIVTVMERPGQTEGVALSTLIAAEDPAAARALVESIVHEPQQVAVFQLSGGTSGVPKIIPRFQSEYLCAMRSVRDFMGLSSDTVTFTPNPLMHNAPMGCFWGPTLLVGGEMAIADGPSLAHIEATLAARRPTWIAMAKVHLLRFLESGGAQRLSFDNVMAFAVPDSAKALGAMLGARAVPMYGMTEGLLAHGAPDDPDETIEFTVGRSTCPHDEIRIVRPGTEEDLQVGEVGELLVRGPSTIRGYFNAPERDAEAFTADGFYRSGDLMSFRMVAGVRNLVFHGRVKDVIDRGGEKINCSEVETAIGQFPSVGSVACVAMPDPLYGERMCAFIALREGEAPLGLDTLRSHLAGLGLAKFKWPERVELVNELPMTTSGKVSKPLMREIIAAKLKTEAAAPPRAD